MSLDWCKVPFKPVRVDESILDKIDLSQYLLEAKYDGFRCILIQNGRTTLWTRQKNKIEMTDNLSEQVKSLNLPEGTVLDGEIWTPAKRGTWRQDKSVQCLLSFWDAIRYGNEDLSSLPIEKRKEKLRGAINGQTPDISTVESFPALKEIYFKIKEEAFRHKQATGVRSGYIHGVVLKRKGSPRRDHPTKSHEHADWIKIVFFS
jgi:ATP-dependent DNA ligase